MHRDAVWHSSATLRSRPIVRHATGFFVIAAAIVGASVVNGCRGIIGYEEGLPADAVDSGDLDASADASTLDTAHDATDATADAEAPAADASDAAVVETSAPDTAASDTSAGDTSALDTTTVD